MPTRTSPPDADTTRVDVVIGVVTRLGKVLICRRPEGKSFAGYWEFPGGKREAGEAVEQCLRRELREELGIEATPVHRLSTIDHDYPKGAIRLHPYVCAHTHGEPQPLASQEVRWVEPRALSGYRFPPANDVLIAEVTEHLSGRPDRPPHPG